MTVNERDSGTENLLPFVSSGHMLRRPAARWRSQRYEFIIFGRRIDFDWSSIVCYTDASLEDAFMPA